MRSLLYKIARVLGDVQAVRRGTIVKRVERKIVWRVLGRIATTLTRSRKHGR